MSNDKLVSALLCLLLLLALSVPAPASESEEELVLGRDVVAYVAQIILLSPPPPLTDSRDRARASFGSQGKIWYN